MSDVLDDPRLDVPTDNIIRSVDFRAEATDDGLTLDGYAAVFGAETEINSAAEGHFIERIAPGAFKRSIGQRTPVIQFDHGQHPMIGTMPIGVIRSIVEDEHGLKVRARLADNWLIQPVRDAIRDGAITGMSFRFKVLKDTWTRSGDMPHRTIETVQLYEVGPVVFPAYSQTTVGVRSRAALDALQDPEVRAEIARIFASGTDLRSLATDPAPAERHAEIDPDAPAPSHAEDSTPAPVKRSARVALAFADL